MAGEARGEGFDNILKDVASHPAKGHAAVPPPGCRPLPKGYAEGQQGVHVHLRVKPLRQGGGARRVGCNLCAIFKRSEVDVDGSGQDRHPGKSLHDWIAIGVTCGARCLSTLLSWWSF